MRNNKIGSRSRGWGRSWLVVVWCLLGVFGSWELVHSSQERYDYDVLGRLVRSIDGQGLATDYLYDSVGNILQVVSGTGAVPAPTITSITPTSVKPGQVAMVTIIGTGLTGATVTPSIPALDISGVLAGSTQVTFVLTVAQGVALGQQSFRITSAAGTATANIDIVGIPPTMSVEPLPLAIPPDNVGRNFTIRLSKPDVVDNVIALAASNQNITVSPATVTIRAGDTAATALVKGVSAGVSAINISSASLGNASIPVFITTEFVGISTGYASPLGVLLTPPPGGGGGVPQMARGILGVTIGKYLGGISPQVVSVGTAAATLTLTGVGLDTVGSIAVLPPDGVTLGARQPASDGKSLALPIAVAANAPTILRRLVVKDAAGVAFSPAAPNADRFLISLPAPEILSINPLAGVAGTNIILTVRGRNLTGAQSVSILPAQGITTGTSPTVSADGTLLTAQINIAPDAALGQRTVVVNSTGGSSSSVPGPANTFTVMLQNGQSFTPIVSAPLGISLAPSTPAMGVPVTAAAPVVGVALGKVVTGINPKLGIVGSSISLTLQGGDLNGVSAVQLTPATGITIGTPNVAADGKTVTVDLTIAADAPQTMRAITVMAGSSKVPFAQAGGDRFTVSVPLPRIDGINPVMLQIGQAPVALTVNGANLQNISAIDIVPGLGITVSSPPVVNAQGTQATVNISATASTATGPRLVTAISPAGRSGAELLPSNTLTLVNGTPLSVSPLLSAPLGVSIATTSTQTLLPLYGPPLGILLQPETASASVMTNATAVGVALGAVATDRSPAVAARGTDAVLTVAGAGLDQASGVRLEPAGGIAIGTISKASDGSAINVPLKLAAEAATGKRKIIIEMSAGNTIDFADAAKGSLHVGAGVPQLDSITPILATQGDRVTLIIRGNNFNDVQAVTFTPPDGIVVSSTPVADSAGTQVAVDIQVLDGAPLGSRVLQVAVPGGVSSDVSVPANTFSVYPK